jgi:hypothetical protein
MGTGAAPARSKTTDGVSAVEAAIKLARGCAVCTPGTDIHSMLSAEKILAMSQEILRSME